jgi:hypothetical protein
MGSFGGNLKTFDRLEFLGESSKKGCTRKHTKNRVTSWSFLFWGNLAILRWFTKRIMLGELEFDVFWGFGRRSTWVHWGGGTTSVSFVSWRNLFRSIVLVLWDLLTNKGWPGARCFLKAVQEALRCILSEGFSLRYSWGVRVTLWPRMYINGGQWP